MRLAVAFLFLLASFACARPDTLYVNADGARSAVGVWESAKAKKTAPVAVWFHGGMTSGNCEKGLVAASDFSSLVPGYTVMSASACHDRHWVTPAAVNWVDAALDSIAARRHSPVDTVYLIGVSDGALGVIFYSMHGKRRAVARVLVSSFGGSLGNATAIARSLSTRGGSWRFVQGGNDRLYPVSMSVPWIEEFCRGVRTGCDLKYDPAGEHDWSYWRNKRKDWVLEPFLRRNP